MDASDDEDDTLLNSSADCIDTWLKNLHPELKILVGELAYYAN